MTNKALAVAVDTSQPWEGPWVTLEKGDWIVTSPLFLSERLFQLEVERNGRTYPLPIGRGVRTTGGCRIRLRVLAPAELGELHLNVEKLNGT